MNAGFAVGRVGSLAAALGIGAALTLGCAVAGADETGSTADTGTTSDSAPGPRATSDTAVSEDGADVTPTPAAGDPESESVKSPARQGSRNRPSIGLPDRSTLAPPSASRNRHRTTVADRIAQVPGAAAPQDATPKRAAVIAGSQATPVGAANVVAPEIASAATPAEPTVTVQVAVDAPVATAAVMTAERPVAAAPSPSVGGVVNSLLAAFGLGSLAADSPVAPVAPPALWGLLAWARQEFERTFAIRTGAQSRTAAALTTAAVAPTAAPATTPVAWVTGSGTTGPYLLKRTNNTAAMFGIAGTDLGIMWDNGIADNPATAVDEHQVLMAFGDTFSGLNQTGTWRSNTLLRSSDQNPADGITVPAGVIGDIFSGSPLSSPNFARQFIRSPGYLGFLGSEVTIIPTAGISVPYDNAYGSRQYVSYMSVKSWDTPGRWTTNYAAVAYSDDNGQTWTVAPSSIRSAGYFRTTTGYVSGNQNFQQSAFVRPPAGSADADYVYMFGTPSGRGGTVYLSRVKQAAVLDQTRYEYWDGANWVANKPSAAKPILPGTTTRTWFSTRTTYPSAGEMSVQYNTYLNKYVMMYADSGNNVVMRTADRPQGPWSAPTTLATSLQYPGLYAPMMDPWTTGQDVYWNMSMWGDYNVLLMHTRLV